MRAQSKVAGRLVMVLLASAALGLAQTSGYPNRTAAPVQPGAVNYVEGEVAVDGQPITESAIGSITLRAGQHLQTGNGFAEVLLTPGAFLRIDHQSDIEVESAGLASTRVRVIKGESLLEVDQLIDGTNLAVDLNQNTAQVEKKGLYDFSANADSVRVLDGKLKLMAATKTESLGKHDQVLLANGDGLKKTEFDMNSVKNTQLYTWSEARSRFEAQSSEAAAQNASYYMAAGSGWYWNPYANYYGFWPASAYLYSPFGFGFYSPIYYGFYGGYYHPIHYGYRGGVVLRSNVSGGFHGGFHGGGGHR